MGGEGFCGGFSTRAPESFRDQTQANDNDNSIGDRYLRSLYPQNENVPYWVKGTVFIRIYLKGSAFLSTLLRGLQEIRTWFLLQKSVFVGL